MDATAPGGDERTARDLVEDIVARRRTLTPQMREVAATVRLDL